MSDELREAMSSERNMDCYLEARSGSEIISDIRSVMAPSLTIRDYFAAAALPAAIEASLSGKIDFATEELISKQAFAFADAMIAARAIGEA